jgi:hypothetical protein
MASGLKTEDEKLTLHPGIVEGRSDLALSSPQTIVQEQIVLGLST